MEQLNFNMLFRWFVGLGLDDGVWDASTFCHNRDRLLDAEVSAKLLTGVVEHRKVRASFEPGPFLSGRHIDRSLGIDEELSPQGRGRRGREDRGATPIGTSMARSARRQPMSSTTDPEARLYRKGNGRESKLCYMGHALMENRHGLVVRRRCYALPVGHGGTRSRP